MGIQNLSPHISVHEDFHGHNQLNLWPPATVCVVFVPDSPNPNRNPDCVSNFIKMSLP